MWTTAVTCYQGEDVRSSWVIPGIQQSWFVPTSRPYKRVVINRHLRIQDHWRTHAKKGRFPLKDSLFLPVTNFWIVTFFPQANSWLINACKEKHFIQTRHHQWSPVNILTLVYSSVTSELCLRSSWFLVYLPGWTSWNFRKKLTFSHVHPVFKVSRFILVE